MYSWQCNYKKCQDLDSFILKIIKLGLSNFSTRSYFYELLRVHCFLDYYSKIFLLLIDLWIHLHLYAIHGFLTSLFFICIPNEFLNIKMMSQKKWHTVTMGYFFYLTHQNIKIDVLKEKGHVFCLFVCVSHLNYD